MARETCMTSKMMKDETENYQGPSTTTNKSFSFLPPTDSEQQVSCIRRMAEKRSHNEMATVRKVTCALHTNLYIFANEKYVLTNHSVILGVKFNSSENHFFCYRNVRKNSICCQSAAHFFHTSFFCRLSTPNGQQIETQW